MTTEEHAELVRRLEVASRSPLKPTQLIVKIATLRALLASAQRDAATAIMDGPPREQFDLRVHLARQREWSERTFGPGDRSAGVVDHIRKELIEIEADPADLVEWIDVVILALDGAWRAGFSPDEIVAALKLKQTRNESREWPDWRTMPKDKAITHVTAQPRRFGNAEKEPLV